MALILWSVFLLINLFTEAIILPIFNKTLLHCLIAMSNASSWSASHLATGHISKSKGGIERLFGICLGFHEHFGGSKLQARRSLMVVSQKNSWFWEENKLLYSGKVLIIAWPMYLDLRKPLLWRNGSLFVHEIWQIHKQHVNEENCVQPKVTIIVTFGWTQFQLLPYSWVIDVKMWFKLQKIANGVLEGGLIGAVSWSNNGLLILSYVLICVKFLFLTITLRILVKFWCFFFRATLGGN